MSLAWSGWKFEPRDIPPAPDVCFYVDLIRVSKHDSGWIFSVENLPASHAALKKVQGNIPLPIDDNR
jgi:hypothetical protein